MMCLARCIGDDFTMTKFSSFTTDLFWLLRFYTTGQNDLLESSHNSRRNSDEFLVAQGSSSNSGVETTTAAAFIPESSNYYPTLGDARAALLSMQNKKPLQESSSLWTGSDRYCESVLYGFLTTFSDVCSGQDLHMISELRTLSIHNIMLVVSKILYAMSHCKWSFFLDICNSWYKINKTQVQRFLNMSLLVVQPWLVSRRCL